MRSLRLILLITLLHYSCDRLGVRVENDGLVGKWRLVEELGDPGDGSGVFRKVNKGAERILEFRKDGTFRETKGPVYSSINTYDRYELLDDNKIQLTSLQNPDMPATIWTYKNLTPTSVTIGFQCIEPCMGKFEATR